MRIGKRFIDQVALPVPEKGKKNAQAIYRDSATPGFGLLVSSGGTKSFFVEKRINGRVKRKSLGRYGSMTVEQARKAAMQHLGQIAMGKDPIAEKRADEVRGVTLIEVFDAYIVSHQNLKPSTVHDYQREMRVSFSDWHNKPIIEITKDMVEARYHKRTKESPSRANNAMRVLRFTFNYAISKYEDAQGNPLILVNPIDRINQTRAWVKVEARQTYIKPHQLKAWFSAIYQLNNETTRDYLLLIIFTGLRRSEASQLMWKDIDFKDKTLTIWETKNHRTHTLPLSDFILDLLSRSHDSSKSDYVFPSKVSKCGYLTEPRTAVQKVIDGSGVEFKIHDLRRTFITIAESLDFSGYALKQLMNHKDPNDVTANYIISNIERLRVPMQKITDFLCEQGEIRRV